MWQILKFVSFNLEFIFMNFFDINTLEVKYKTFFSKLLLEMYCIYKYFF